MAHIEILLLPMERGLVAFVDVADRDLVAGFRWRVFDDPKTTRLYAHAWHKQLHFYMHRLVLGVPDGVWVDHANGEGLDNRRLNLRQASPSQNGANRDADRRMRGKTSRYKGVAWDKARGRWKAWIHVNGKTRQLGRFRSEDEAAAAYNLAAEAAWGDYARLNVLLTT